MNYYFVLNFFMWQDTGLRCLVKARLYSFFVTKKARAFRDEWAVTYSLVVAQPIRTQH